MRSNPVLKITDRAVGRLCFAALRMHDFVRRAVRKRYRRATVGDEEVGTVVAIKLCCLGDGILAVPALRALKRRWPSARLVVVCTPRSVGAFEGLPFLDELVCLPVSGLGGMREAVRSAMTVVREVRRLRRAKPAVVVDLDLYYRATPVIGYLTGAPVRVGFDTAGCNRAGLFTASVPRDREKWELECFLDVVSLVGAQTDDKRLELPIAAEARERADEILATEGFAPGEEYVALCPGSSKNWPAKQWPAARFAQVANWVAQHYGLRCVLVGAGFERALYEDVAARCDVRPVNLAGATTVAETAAVLARARALVTNDTGPMHMATAVGTPVVAIFGPTDERKWGPRGPWDVVIRNDACTCRPCYYLSYMPDCSDRQCLLGIPTERVTEALAQVLGGRDSRGGHGAR